MRRVILESPYAGAIARNVRYGRACLLDCLKRGEAPMAGHLLYTQPGVLWDAMPEDRHLGIEASFAWRGVASATVVYSDLGISPGMKAGIEHSLSIGVPVEYRTLPGWEKQDGFR